MKTFAPVYLPEFLYFNLNSFPLSKHLYLRHEHVGKMKVKANGRQWPIVDNTKD